MTATSGIKDLGIPMKLPILQTGFLQNMMRMTQTVSIIHQINNLSL